MSSRQCPTQRVVNALCCPTQTRVHVPPFRRPPFRYGGLCASSTTLVPAPRAAVLLPHRRHTCAALCWQLSTTATTKLFSMRNPKPSGRSAHPEKSPLREVSSSREAARGSDLAALPAAGVQRCRTLLFRPSGSCVSWSHLQRRVALSTPTSRLASTAKAAVFRAANRSLSVKAAIA